MLKRFMTGCRSARSRLWQQRSNHIGLFCAAVLCGLGFYVLITWPIMKTDTDLWFHLSWGRELFEHHRIPSDSSFSFIEPVRHWVNYAWLFQALVYACYLQAGYYGLVVFRSVVYLATAVLVLRYLFADATEKVPQGWRAFVFGLLWLVLLPRYELVRPFLVTDLCIIVFLSVLERHPHRALWLPVLGVFWSNLHGVTYPIMLAICGAYGAEYLWGRFRGRAYHVKDERFFFVPVVLTMLSVLVTPHGVRLMGTPFRPLEYLSHAIMELWQVGPTDLLSFQWIQMTPTLRTVLNGFVLVTVSALLASCATRRVRVSHLVLCVAGLFLATKGERFMPECALLALPLLTHVPQAVRGSVDLHLSKPFAVVTTAFLMAMPVTFALKVFGQRLAYPFSRQGLPEGVATFLNHVGVGGTVLNHANNGGYFRWRLAPRYRIFLDMESLFTDEEFYLDEHAFREPEVLRKLIARYDPSFVTMPISLGEYGTLMKHFPQYEMVFFDDTEVLFVNRRQHPEIASRYAVRGADPLTLWTEPFDSLLAEESVEPLMRSLAALVAIYPEAGVAQRLIAVQYNRDHAYDRALAHAQIITQHYPASPEGHRLVGEALKGLGAFEQALAAYRKALVRVEPAERDGVRMMMGLIELERGRYRAAYGLLRKAVDVFSPEATIDDVYHFASAARLAGKTEIARAALNFLYEFRVPPEDTRWRETLRADLALVGGAEAAKR